MSVEIRGAFYAMPTQVCRSFLKGSCTYNPCKFLHAERGAPGTLESDAATDDRKQTHRDGKDRRRHQCNVAAAEPSQASRSHGVPVESEYETTPEENQPRAGASVSGRHRSSRKSNAVHNSNRHELGVSKLPMPRVNTESFTPSHEPCTMRVVVDLDPSALTVPLTVRDVLCAPCVFNKPHDETIYARLVDEIEGCGIDEADLLKSWHGDSHWIADDSTGWKKKCPTFLDVIQRIKSYFNMDIKATRFNWYKDTSEWKPYHHDAAAVKPDKARTQNFTVAVSFGATRVAAFEDAKTKTTVAFPQPNGYMYCFARDTNILWRHGILQDSDVRKEGRISIIAWGWVDGIEEC